VPSLFQISTYIKYWLEAIERHSLHSPFFFDFYTKVIRQKSTHDFSALEKLRSKLLHDNREVSYQDQGARATHHANMIRKVSEIASMSLTTAKYAALYNRIIKFYDAKCIVELGTSLGITTLYLSSKADAQVTTFEGSAPIADIARTTFDFARADNITLIEGNIDSTLPAYLQSSPRLDVAFIDANHRYEPTKRYFELLLRKSHAKTIFILDDIHYSTEMQKAWNEIIQNPLVYASVDLYRCGLVFFDPSLSRQHVVLQF
jgi:predicted O-methyltransferase YrrM